MPRLKLTGLRDSTLLAACLCMLVIQYLLSGCAASHPEPATEQPAVNPDTPLQLPAPAGLPRITSQPGESSLLGSQFIPELPHNRVTVTGDSALFDPVGGDRLEDNAYAAYRISVLAPEDVHPRLVMGWTAAEQPFEGCWLALANWLSNSWEWHYLPNYNSVGPTSVFSPLDFSPYLKTEDGAGYMYAVVLVDSAPPARLMWLHLGTDSPIGGYITAEATEPPRSLNLELVPSPDDGSITSVDWDFESDGTIDAHSVFTTTHTYPESDIYKITAYLTDLDGTLRIREKFVPVSPWSFAPQQLDTEWGAADALLDDSNVVHLAFLRDPGEDDQPPFDLLYATNSEGIWTEEAVCQVNCVSQPVLDVGDEKVHIILLDTIDFDREFIRYAWREADEWQNMQLVDDDYYAYSRPDLALDSSGIVHIVYHGMGVNGGYDAIRYANSAAGFSFTSVPLSFEPWRGLALAVDGADQPHLVCTVQLSYQQISCAWAYFDGTQWNSELVGESAYDCTAWDILIDDLQQPNLLYLSMESTSGRQPSCPLRLCTRTDGSWQIDELSSVDNLYVSNSTSGRLALDAGGQVMLAVGKPNGWDFGLDGINWFIYHDGSAWHSEVLEFQSYGGTLFGFGLDPQGRPWMCYDGPEPRLATRME